MKRSIPWTARVIVSMGLFAIIAMFVPLADLWAAVRSVPLWLAAVAFLGFLVGHVISAVKWWLLMGPHAVISPQLALRAHFAGLTANLCLPGIAGGDVIRAAWVMRGSHEKAGIGVASLADRLLDCVALLLLSGVGVLFTAQFSGPIGTALLIAAGVVLVPSIAAGPTYLIFRRRRPQSLLNRIAEAIEVMASRPGVLLGSFVLSLIVQSGFVSLNYWLGQAAGVEAPFVAWLVAWPLAKLIALAPVSLNGLGVREAALVFLMRPFGAAAAAVTATSLYWQALLTCGSLVGGLAIAAPQRARTSEVVAV